MRTLISRFINATLIIGGLTVATSAFARPEGGERSKRGAPPEAIEACVDKSVGQTCEFNGRRGSVTGICFLPGDDNSELACKPEGHDERSQQNTRD